MTWKAETGRTDEIEVRQDGREERVGGWEKKVDEEGRSGEAAITIH